MRSTIRGSMRYVVEVEPRFDYARASHTTRLDRVGAVFESESLSLGLSAPKTL